MSKNRISLTLASISLMLGGLSLISCQKTLLPSSQFYANYYGTEYELQLDSAFSYYHLTIDKVQQYSVDNEGTYRTVKNKLFLNPYPGKYFWEENPPNDSLYYLEIFEESTGDPVVNFKLTIKERGIDSVIFDHSVQLIQGKPGLGVGVFSIACSPYYFRLGPPGKYQVYLYEEVRNPDLLTWKIRKEKLTLNKFILWKTKE
ncbi:MAG: hypothetical protein R3C61_08135 [Bacteroidia bacterium]